MNQPAIQLNNQATIRAYFEKVRQMAKSGEQYPVNLDEVWPLVYAEKGVAVRALKKGFYENEDFTLLDQNVKQKRGGHNEEIYLLTVPCMEYLVARKIRSVFEVYTSVFHAVADQLEAKALAPTTFNPSSISRREMAMMILNAEEEIERLNKEVEERGKVIISQSKKVAYVDGVLTATNCLLVTQIAKDLGMSATALNKLLEHLGVQFKQRGQWVLKAQYQNKGYTKDTTHTYPGSDGSIKTSHSTEWTELGRAFIVKKVTDYRNRQLAIQSASTSPSAAA